MLGEARPEHLGAASVCFGQNRKATGKVGTRIRPAGLCPADPRTRMIARRGRIDAQNGSAGMTGTRAPVKPSAGSSGGCLTSGLGNDWNDGRTAKQFAVPLETWHRPGRRRGGSAKTVAENDRQPLQPDERHPHKHPPSRSQRAVSLLGTVNHPGHSTEIQGVDTLTPAKRPNGTGRPLPAIMARSSQILRL